MNSGTDANKLIAVLDSNVIFSGFAFPRGNPARILYAVEEGKIQTYISPLILEEVSRNWREKFGWEEARIELALVFLRAYCTVIDPSRQSSLRELSPQDNRVLDCAIQCQAQYLVTGDRGVLQLGEHKGIRIVNPRDFLAIVETA